MKEADQYFESHQEPVKSCLTAMRKVILNYDQHITEVWRYRMPFYCYGDKRFCYLWYDKKRKLPYLGLTDGKLYSDPDLLQESRSRMKIFLLDPEKNLPIARIRQILKVSIKKLSNP